jgi:hypothetical protein
MRRITWSVLWRALPVLLSLALYACSVSAQNPFFTGSAPSVISGSGNTLTVVLVVTNSGGIAASSVNVTGIQLSGNAATSPATYPITVGDIAAASTFPINATFNGGKFTAGTKNLLAVRGTYSYGGSTQGFTVNRYVTIPAAQSAISGGVQVPIPAGFQADIGTLSLAGPLSLNNFATHYPEGGVVPAGGAVVDITSLPVPADSLSDFIATELAGANIASTKAITVGGSPATEVTYSDSYTAMLTIKEVGVYVVRGNTLHKIYLSYQAGDPNETTFLADFQHILNSLQFKS